MEILSALLKLFGDAFDFIVRVFERAPPAFWPVLVGFLVSMIGTQWLKFWLPGGWSERARERACRLIAFFLGVGVTWFLWPDRYGFFCGLLSGMSSPITYWALAKTVERRWPWLQRKISQDHKPHNL